MSEEQSEYVGGLLLIGFMHRLYEEYVDSSVLWLLKKTLSCDTAALNRDGWWPPKVSLSLEISRVSL